MKWQGLKKFLCDFFAECEKSPTLKHEWVEPRMEDSVDKMREIPTTYCRHCFLPQESYLRQIPFVPWY